MTQQKKQLQHRFLLWLASILSVVLLAIAVIFYYITRDQVEEEALRSIRQIADSVTSVQDFVRQTLRPQLYSELGGDKFIESMSTSFVARVVMENFLQRYPGYHFKFASRKPFNPVNLASPAEQRVIDRFQADAGMTEWSGVIERDGAPYLTLVKPIIYTATCLRCHGDPADAPLQLLARYPQGGGFGIRDLDVGILSIGAPLSKTRAEVIRDTLVNLVPIALLMLLFVLLASRFFRRYVSVPIGTVQQGAERILKGDFDTRIAIREGAEFQGVADVFNHMAQSIRDEIDRRKQSEARVTRDFQTQQALSQILQLSLQKKPLREQLQQVLKILLALPWLGGESSARIFLQCPESGTLELAAEAGVAIADAADCGIETDPLCRQALTQQCLMSDDQPPDHLPAGEEQPRVRYCAPIVNDDQLLGVLVLYRFSDRVTEGELALLQSVVGSLSGMIEHEHAKVALCDSEERFALAVNGANDGIWDWDLVNDRLYASSRFCRMLGLDEDDPPCNSSLWFRRVHPDELMLLKSAVSAHLNGQASSFSCEFRMRHEDGSWVWMQSRGVAVFDADGKPLRMAGSQTDISDRKRMEQQLEHDAFHDPLSGLFNRAMLMTRLRQSLAHIQRHPARQFAVLFLDLDRFKNINDSLGHGAGDQVIIEVADRLSRLVRPEDTVARLGGDEFVLLLDSINGYLDATHAAERVHAQLERPLQIDGNEVYISTSIGIVLSSPDYRHEDEILRDADIAMYRAKARGKSHYQVFDAEMHRQAVQQLQLENDLRRALEHNELTAFYQPIVELCCGHIVGFEALVRWQHPQRGLVMPADFIPVAEETGLIVALGERMIDIACRDILAWSDLHPAAGGLYISINLSSKQFLHAGLLPFINQRLAEHGVAAEQIRFEVTESVLMDDVEATGKLLHQLRESGFRLYIDDFGTGYSSLSYLHKFPFDTLKIDRSFINELNSDSRSGMVTSIINLARNLEMDVVAEGVESSGQVGQLIELGCEYAQGYHYSRPVTADAAAALLHQMGVSGQTA